MSRNAYAVDALVAQVLDTYPDAEFAYGEPDGLDVVREVTISKARGLGATLQANPDERIAELSTRGGRVYVTVVADSPRADDRAPFVVDPGEVEPEPEQPPA